MKRRESVWMLNYLISHDHLLNNVHFVEDVELADRGLMISTTDAEDVPFRFHKGSMETTDAEKAFHDLRLNPDEKMYIQINFAESFQRQEYIAVLEDVVTMDNQNKKEGVIGVSEEIEKLVSEITASNNRVSLMNEIDKALDNGDKELFMQLSRMLNEQKEMKVVSFSA